MVIYNDVSAKLKEETGFKANDKTLLYALMRLKVFYRY